MIDGRGRVRLTDFGLAGFLDELAETRTTAGTPAYMAPEQLDQGLVSVRSDVYSLGLILYELLTGKRYFEANDLQALRSERTSSNVDSSVPSTVIKDIDASIDHVVARCGGGHPRLRFPLLAGRTARVR